MLPPIRIGLSSAEPCGSLCSLHGGIDFAFLGQPRHIALVCVFLYLSKELNSFRLVAGLRRVINWNNHLDLNGNHVLLSLDEARPLDSLSGNAHDSSLYRTSGLLPTWQRHSDADATKRP